MLDSLDLEPALPGQQAAQVLAVSNRSLVAPGESIQVMQRNGSRLPGMVDLRTEWVPQGADGLQRTRRPGKNRSERRVEVFVQRDVDSIEMLGILCSSNARVGRRKKHSGSIQVRSDFLLASVGADLLHLLKVEDLATGSAHGRLNGNRTHGGG